MNLSRKITAHPIAITLALATLALAEPARAGFIASDLGSGNSFNQISGYTLSGAQSAAGLGYGLAVEFQITGPLPIAFGSAQLALECHSGLNAVNVLLLSDSGGAPGSTLESIALNNLPVGPALVTATSTTHTMLTPGATYWLAAVASGNSYLSWMMNTQGMVNDLDYEIDHGSGPLGWQSAGSGNPDVAYAISAVPTPPSAILLGCGLISFAGFTADRRRRGASGTGSAGGVEPLAE